jgi:pimeloyl-ACP methyl ester carboxylesterase
MWWLLVIGYGIIVLIAAAAQRRLIYYPTKLNFGAARAAAAQISFTPWSDQAGQVIGWKMATSGSSTGSVLIAHGNAGCALDRDYFAMPLREAFPDLDVYVLEYPGYGAREGSPGMKAILAAAEAAFDTLPQDKPVYLVSESIGAGAITHLARTRGARVRGIALFVPFDDLAGVGQAAMPLLPVKLVLRDRYQPARWLKDYRGPVMVVLAGADTIIPSRFGQRLFDGYQGPKKLDLIANAGHNDVAEQSPEWWREVYAFWQSASTNTGGR